jgi:hypothetical protein
VPRRLPLWQFRKVKKSKNDQPRIYANGRESEAEWHMASSRPQIYPNNQQQRERPHSRNTGSADKLADFIPGCAPAKICPEPAGIAIQFRVKIRDLLQD